MFARENIAIKAEAYGTTTLARNNFKKFYKGKYTLRERSGEECVCKSFIIFGSVFEEHYFQVELKSDWKSTWNHHQLQHDEIIRQTIFWLNKPQILTFSPSSTREGEKVLVELMISNFKKFNSTQ